MRRSRMYESTLLVNELMNVDRSLGAVSDDALGVDEEALFGRSSMVGCASAVDCMTGAIS